MKRIRLSLVAIALLGLPAITYAGDMVPFSARGGFSGTKDPIVNGEQLIHLGVFVQATHLGRSTGTALYVLNTNLGTFHGDFDFTGANGDQVFFHAEGFLTPVLLPCLFDFSQTVTVLGGTSTGKFADATGVLMSTGHFDYCNVAGTATFDGTITRPHSRGPNQ